ncbi:F-box domain-containing protein [Artemisia annua]|uniref:F-box domain-containing protein n=1 Tax=Artemisia annua TaxID=35608 RepID=A0A2U1LF08_ARTAN|nr:F-box domain-containing protein [Artemisia annua]
MAELASDTIFDILSRLPVKCLARFSCVSKPWCAYIDDDYFGILHGKRAVEELTPVMYDSNLSRIIGFDIIKSEEGNFTMEAKKGMSLKKEFYELPPMQRLLGGPYYLSEDSRGLGFDVSTNTFKMVCIFSRREFSEISETISKDLCTMVHVLGIDHSWREIPKVPPYPIYGDGIFSHGCLYWLAPYREPKPKSREELICFDLRNEEFKTICPPKKPEEPAFGGSQYRG